jgi:ankyrin repeat protein
MHKFPFDIALQFILSKFIIPLMKIKHLFLLLVLASFVSCLSDSENNSNDLKRKIEEGVLNMLFQTDRPCSEEENAIMIAVDSGNYEVVMDYLQNGGDPMLECKCNKNSHYGCTYTRLYSYMEHCDTVEYVKYYLSLDISDEIKNDFLLHYLVLKKDEMASHLISIGALLEDNYFCFDTSLPLIKKAIDLGYDINSRDPDSGWTLLMEFAFCETEEYVDCKIEGIAYLISEGALLDLKDNDGKTALDIATNEEIKAYLMSLEE